MYLKLHKTTQDFLNMYRNHGKVLKVIYNKSWKELKLKGNSNHDPNRNANNNNNKNNHNNEKIKNKYKNKTKKNMIINKQ